MSAVEQAGLPTTSTYDIHDLQRVTVHNMDFHIGSVSHVNKFLIIVLGKGNVPSGTGTDSHRGDLCFFDKGTIGSKHLDPVRTPVTHIYKPVLRRFGAMNRANELLRQRFTRDVCDTVI